MFGEGAWPTDVDPGPLTGLGLGVVPVPRPAIDTVAAAAGVPDAGRAGDRLAALGLLDVCGRQLGLPGGGGVAV